MSDPMLLVTIMCALIVLVVVFALSWLASGSWIVGIVVALLALVALYILAYVIGISSPTS